MHTRRTTQPSRTTRDLEADHRSPQRLITAADQHIPQHVHMYTYVNVHCPNAGEEQHDHARQEVHWDEKLQDDVRARLHDAIQRMKRYGSVR